MTTESTLFRALLMLTCLLAVISGCAQTQEQGAVSHQADRKAASLDFFDAGSFDNKLYAALAKDSPRVQIRFPAPITLNKIPERLDKWFSMVEKHGGKVALEAEPEPPSRGIITEVISLIVGAYGVLKEKWLYDPVKNYDATVHYLPSTGKVTKVVFTRKQPR